MRPCSAAACGRAERRRFGAARRRRQAGARRRRCRRGRAAARGAAAVRQRGLAARRARSCASVRRVPGSTASRPRPWRATMRLSSASASIWSTITRRICAALSAVSCGSSRMPLRSSVRVASSSCCISAAICLRPSTTSAKRWAACVEHLLAVAGGLLVDVAHRLRGALVFLLVRRADALEVLRDRARALVGRVGDQAGDLAGAVAGAFERLVEQLGEAREPRLQVLRLVVERGDHARERLVERAGEAADAGLDVLGLAVEVVDQRLERLACAR